MTSAMAVMITNATPIRIQSSNRVSQSFVMGKKDRALPKKGATSAK
jgi:hypothetical protein